MYTHLPLYVCTFIHVCVYIACIPGEFYDTVPCYNIYVYIHIYIYTHMYIYICICICICVCEYAHVHIFLYYMIYDL